MNGEIIFILWTPMLGHIRQMKGNFKHLVHESWPRTCGGIVLKFYKKQTNSEKLWDLSKYHDIISEGCDKKLRRYSIICHIRFLQSVASLKKNRTVEKDHIRFGVKMTVKLRFDFKTFYISNRQNILFHVKFW